jgi:hypothetical protein
MSDIKLQNNDNRFPNSKREEWEKIFPSFTTKEEIGLVDGLVKYNPRQRLTAAEVSVKLYELLRFSDYHQRQLHFKSFLIISLLQALCHEYFG